LKFLILNKCSLQGLLKLLEQIGNIVVICKPVSVKFLWPNDRRDSAQRRGLRALPRGGVRRAGMANSPSPDTEVPARRSSFDRTQSATGKSAAPAWCQAGAGSTAGDVTANATEVTGSRKIDLGGLDHRVDDRNDADQASTECNPLDLHGQHFDRMS
jgi:hypothetical protein